MTQKFQLGFAAILLFLAISCTKENNSPLTAQSSQSPSATQSNDAPAENKEKLFEKSLIVYNADKTNSTTLRFRAASKEQLDKMPLENLEFTLVKTPESATETRGLTASTIAGDEGSSDYSDQNASLSPSANEKQVLPEDAIIVDLPNLPKTKSISIDVKSKDLNKVQAATTTFSKFYYYSWCHKIKVTNTGSIPIDVFFYYELFGWHYANLHFRLSQGGWARYSNCFFTVGAKVVYPSGAHYVVAFSSSCF